LSRLLVLSASLLLSFGLIEVYLRVFPPVAHLRPPMTTEAWREVAHQRSSIPGLDYELRPNVEGFAAETPIRTNHFGMRDRELTIERPESTIRIAVLGDSFTFGMGVAADAPYPKALERLLNESRRDESCRFEALNFGVSGYSTKDEAALLEHRVIGWDPDLVVVGYVLNDPEDEPVDPLHWYYADHAWWQRSYALHFFSSVRRIWGIRVLAGRDYTRWLHVDSAKWDGVVGAFQDIERVADENGIEVVLTIFPIFPWERWQDYRYADLHVQVAGAAEGAGLHVIDLHPVYLEYPPADLRVSEQDNHPNRVAHDLAGRAIRERILGDPPALLAPVPGGLLQRCIASGTVPPPS
jgi:hypothetical protein